MQLVFILTYLLTYRTSCTGHCADWCAMGCDMIGTTWNRQDPGGWNEACLMSADLTGSGFDLAWLSCLPSASVSSVYLVLYVENNFDYILFFTFYRAEPVGLALDLEDYHPSVLLHYWLGHLTCKIVSEMTYNVSSGTLNHTIRTSSG